MGLISLTFGWIPVLGWIILLMTIGFGFINLDVLKENKDKSGESLTIAGIAPGCIVVIFKLLITVDILKF